MTSGIARIGLSRTSPSGRAIRAAMMDLDTRTIREAQRVFTNSQVVASRLKNFNGIAAQPLYPPILAPERFRNDGYGDEIVIICRVELHKRQWLLVEAMRHVKTPVKLRICGTSMNSTHLDLDSSSNHETPARIQSCFRRSLDL